MSHKIQIKNVAREICAAINMVHAEKVLAPYFEELASISLQLHGIHSIVGPNRRMDEWKECVVPRCQRRYQLLYGKEE
jgi:hypothetical protein